MITAASLREQKFKELAQMARKRGIPGWHSMRKDDLIKAIVKAAKPTKKTTRRNGKVNTKTSNPANGKTTSSSRRKMDPTSPRRNSSADLRGRKASALKSNPKTKPRPSKIAKKIQREKRASDKLKDLATDSNQKSVNQNDLKDRVVLLVRDPYWLQANWGLTNSLIQRAKAGMAQFWHTAKPVLRIFEVSKGNTSSANEKHIRDIEIHGGVSTWFIDVKDPPKAYRVEIGYLAANDRFHALVRSNTVSTPQPGGSDSIDENWSDIARNCEKIFALSGGYSTDNENDAREIQELFEERFQRPMDAPIVTRYGVGQPSVTNGSKFDFDVDAEMIVYGSTKSDAHVTIRGEPVKLRTDGSFTVRLSMPERRQVLPVVASSSDGSKQQTIVLAIERNTKVMEPIQNDTKA